MTHEKHQDTILVVDDDDNFRELVRLVADDIGIRCVAAKNGAEGIERVKEEGSRLRLILLDYFMPGIEPKDCAKGIFQVRSPSTRIVLVTAAVDASNRAAELGIDQWLSKPFEIDDLEDLITGLT
jgi:CheY-like chemotaxis protein